MSTLIHKDINGSVRFGQKTRVGRTTAGDTVVIVADGPRDYAAALSPERAVNVAVNILSMTLFTHPDIDLSDLMERVEAEVVMMTKFAAEMGGRL